MKFDASLLASLARDIIESSGDEFNSNYRDPKTQKLFTIKIKFTWVSSYMNRFNNVPRAASGKRSASPSNAEFIENKVAFHLGSM